MDCVESSSFVAYGVLGTLPHMLKRWIPYPVDLDNAIDFHKTDPLPND